MMHVTFEIFVKRNARLKVWISRSGNLNLRVASKPHGVTMNTVVFLLNILIVAVVSGGPAWKEVQRGGGLKVGLGVGKNATGSRGNGLRIGTGRSGRTSTTSTTMAPPEEELVHTPAVPVSPTGLKNLYVGIVVPYKSFGVREYTKAITSTKHNLQRKLKLFKKYDIKVHIVMKELTPSPTGTLFANCCLPFCRYDCVVWWVLLLHYHITVQSMRYVSTHWWLWVQSLYYFVLWGIPYMHNNIKFIRNLSEVLNTVDVSFLLSCQRLSFRYIQINLNAGLQELHITPETTLFLRSESDKSESYT